MFGLLNLDKPVGWTSRDVVNRVQNLVRPAKAGHAGTLDPLATGVLVVCIGQATRLISHVQQQPKTYAATLLLGRSSASDDIESEVVEYPLARQPTRTDIEAMLPRFLGSIQQRPPAYSAIKVGGKRAYDRARRGEDVQLEPRPVEIYELAIDDYCYPELQLTMRCGSGTYVRSLGRDLAEALGTSAVMSALTRTAIGEFAVENAIDVENLDSIELAEHLCSPLLAVPHLSQITLSEAQATEIRHGRLICTSEVTTSPPKADEVFAAVSSDGQLLALLCEKRPGWLGPTCNFSQSS